MWPDTIIKARLTQTHLKCKTQKLNMWGECLRNQVWPNLNFFKNMIYQRFRLTLYGRLWSSSLFLSIFCCNVSIIQRIFKSFFTYLYVTSILKFSLSLTFVLTFARFRAISVAGARNSVHVFMFQSDVCDMIFTTLYVTFISFLKGKYSLALLL